MENQMNAPIEQHARFGCELRMDFMSAFQGFLQKNRNGEAIGILEIDLINFDIRGN
jgi:hypothetical protein